jgi:hypothetical protein
MSLSLPICLKAGCILEHCRDSRLREHERLEFALDAMTRRLDEFEERIGRWQCGLGADLFDPRNKFASRIMSAMERFRAIGGPLPLD